MENVTKIYSENLKKLLEQNNMNMSQLGWATKIPISTINDYVNARAFPRAKNLEKIAYYFKVTVSSMLTY